MNQERIDRALAYAKRGFKGKVFFDKETGLIIQEAWMRNRLSRSVDALLEDEAMHELYKD